MSGNFQKFSRVLERLEAIKTTTIRNLLNHEEQMLIQTEEDDFNERFKSEAAGSSALMGLDEEEDDLGDKGAARLASGTLDSDMHREMLL